MADLTASQQQLFEEWYSDQTRVEVDRDELIKKIEKEFDFAKNLGDGLSETDQIKKYTFWRNWERSRYFYPKSDNEEKKSIKKTERKIWIPKSDDDWFKLKPEVIFVQNHFPIPYVSIWGNERIDFLINPDGLSEDYQNLRNLTSVAENLGNVGRTLRFLVRDRVTKKYLGLMTIASDYAEVKTRNDYIGWAKEQRDGGKLNNTAVGSVLVPTQPFGYNFLGGKLIALMATSNVVADTWERLYGDKLVGVTTTSLYGQTNAGTQYTGLKPYWKSLGLTAGATVVRTSQETEDLLRTWMKSEYPEDYWYYFEAKTPDGLPAVRSNAERARTFCYRQLGFKKKDTETKHQRGVYFSELYKNTNEFLRDEIGTDELVRKFDNSVESLTTYWRDKHATKRFEKLKSENRLDFEMRQYMSSLPYLSFEAALNEYF